MGQTILVRHVRCKKNRSLGRINKLTEQISQHYIYNSLQLIAGLCDKDPAKAKEAILSFADYLRINLENVTEEILIMFGRELEHTQVYLKLEKLEGEHDFDVEYRLGITDFMMPPLVLEPVVENAVKYGAAPPGGKNRIVIETYERWGNIVIEVTNTVAGESFRPEQRSGRKNIGLENVTARLASSCRGTLNMETAGGVTKVTIKMPKRACAIKSGVN